jgi:PAS domain S-box-containing protein
MTGDKSPVPKFSTLRRKAEERLQINSSIFLEKVEGLTSGQALELFQELRIHQVELEMQNEDLRRAQLELERSRARYFELYDLAPVGYLTLTAGGVIQEANLTAARLLRQERYDLIGLPFTRFVAREDQDSYYLYGKRLRQAGSQQTCELRLGRNGGLPFWARLEMSVVLDMEEEVSGFRAVFMDISEQKRAQESLEKVQLELEQRVKVRTKELEQANLALQESEEHFRQIVEILPVAVIGQCNQEIVFCNTAALDLLHALSYHSLRGKDILEYLHSDYKELFVQNLHRVTEGVVDNISFPARLFHLQNDAVDVELHLIPFNYRGQTAVQISAFDITRRKKVEQELQNREKLEAVGTLAGGIAHDFNNYLATLLGNVSLARAYLDNREKVCEKLENMEKVTLRAKNLTDQLSIFARGGAPVKKKVLIRELISDSVSFALSGSSVQCELALPDTLHAVEIDEGQINQVLYNIVLNAVAGHAGRGHNQGYWGKRLLRRGIKRRSSPPAAG